MYTNCNRDSRFGRYSEASGPGYQQYDLDLFADPPTTNAPPEPTPTPSTAPIVASPEAFDRWQIQLQEMIKTTVQDTLEQSRSDTRSTLTARADLRASMDPPEPTTWSWTEIMLGVILVVLIIAFVIIVIMGVAAAGVALGRSYGSSR